MIGAGLRHPLIRVWGFALFGALMCGESVEEKAYFLWQYLRQSVERSSTFMTSLSAKKKNSRSRGEAQCTLAGRGWNRGAVQGGCPSCGLAGPPAPFLPQPLLASCREQRSGAGRGI